MDMTNLLQNDLKALLRAKSKKTEALMERLSEGTIHGRALAPGTIDLHDHNMPYDMYIGHTRLQYNLPCNRIEFFTANSRRSPGPQNTG